MTMSGDAYIRPCPAFPDGYEIPRDIVPELLRRKLIGPDEGWQERGTEPGDYVAMYDPWDEADIDRAAFDIEQAVREWIAPFQKDSADPFERDSRGVAIGFLDDDPMGYEW